MNGLPDGTKPGDFDFDNEDDLTSYDVVQPVKISGIWDQQNLPFKTATLSDGTEVPK